MSNGSEIPLRVTGDYKLAEEWELVLLAQGLSPTLRRSPDGVVLAIPEHDVEKARAALLAYERENSQRPAERAEPGSSAGSFVASATAGILIMGFFIITTISDSTMSWFERGSGDVYKILSGELWRTVTALSLHADVAHALSNAVAVALFLGLLSSFLGTGVAAALILLAGALGNFANALLHSPPHVSIGASTSVFGAVGMLGGLGIVMRRRRTASRRRAWLPVGASLALLGMLGTGGERVDVWAHLFGLVGGAVLGMLTALVAPRPPRAGIRWACGAAAAAVLIYCWTLALW
jgi:membrane associated rhomboid family serine protease